MTEEQDKTTLQYVQFMVANRPRCVWEWDIREFHAGSVKKIDPLYFSFQASTLASELESDNKYRAACAIRANYWHALESFLALLFATLQAPHATYAWLIEFRPGDLHWLAERLNDGTRFLTGLHIEPFGWEGVGERLLPNADDQELTRVFHDKVLGAWQRFSREFVDPIHRSEHNTIKHGMRVLSRGHSISIAKADSTDFTSLGGSEHGAQFLLRETLGTSKHHFRARPQSENWSVEATIEKTNLLATSIQLLKVFLLNRLGALESDVDLMLPERLDSFEEPWRMSPGVLRSNYARDIPLDAINWFTPDEIRRTFSEPQKENEKGA